MICWSKNFPRFQSFFDGSMSFYVPDVLLCSCLSYTGFVVEARNFYPPLARVMVRVPCGVRIGQNGAKLQIIYMKTVYIYVFFTSCVLPDVRPV